MCAGDQSFIFQGQRKGLNRPGQTSACDASTPRLSRRLAQQQGARVPAGSPLGQRELGPLTLGRELRDQGTRRCLLLPSPSLN